MEPSVPPVPLPLAKSWLLGGRQLHVPCYGRGWDDNDPEGKGGKGKRNGERRKRNKKGQNHIAKLLRPGDTLPECSS